MIPERIIPRARWTMAGSLAAAVTLAVGHHAFYSHLAGQHPSDPYSPSWGFFSLGITPQQLNLATGSAFAFIVKAFLGLAVSTAHDQAVWQRIRKVPTSTAVIDGMFGARSSLLDALSLRNWRTSFLTMGLALLYWYVYPKLSRHQHGSLFSQLVLNLKGTDFLFQASAHCCLLHPRNIDNPVASS